MNEGSRWSCAPRLGGDCSISYNLGAVRDLAELRLGERHVMYLAFVNICIDIHRQPASNNNGGRVDNG